ncbi:MAG: hypothetical protein ACRCX8_15260 [Sarcina sp.]
MKIKKGKATLLALASAALVASLLYDKKLKKDNDNKEEDEQEQENSFTIK